MRFRRYFIILLAIWSFILIVQNGFSEELTSIHQTNLNLVERLARLEEGQKAIIVEMRTRFEAVDKRFDSVDKRFDSVDKRFESVDKRFESVDKRFESVDKRFEMMEKRIEMMERQFDKRFESLENQISQQGSFIIAMLAAIIALITYVIWDRRTAFDKAFSEALKKIEQLFTVHIDQYHHTVEPVVHKEKRSSTAFQEQSNQSTNHQKNEDFSIPKNIQEKFQDVVNFMNQFPEMRPIIQAA